MKFLTTVVPFLAFNLRPKGTVVDTVILHATAGGTLRSSYLYLRGLTKDRASYHAGADRDGSRLKLVPLSARAWHAGVCFRGIGRESLDVNNYSVGFAFANRNDGEKVTTAQIESAIEWINEAKTQLPLRYLSTHAGIAHPRKSDVLSAALSDAQLEEIARRTGLEYVRGRRQ